MEQLGRIEMSRHDVGIGILLLLLSGFFCYGAIGLGIGKIHYPGPGFFPFLAGIILAGLSVALIVSGEKRSHSTPKNDVLFTGQSVLILAILLLFGFLVEKLGFFLCAFGAAVFLLKIVSEKKWPFLLLVSFSACFVIFILFNLLLDVRLPLGVLDFLIGR
jgi:putative tricarboxylic transport membrane protein